jgi:hypothetical protein
MRERVCVCVRVCERERVCVCVLIWRIIKLKLINSYFRFNPEFDKEVPEKYKKLEIIDGGESTVIVSILDDVEKKIRTILSWRKWEITVMYDREE